MKYDLLHQLSCYQYIDDIKIIYSQFNLVLNNDDIYHIFLQYITNSNILSLNQQLINQQLSKKISIRKLKYSIQCHNYIIFKIQKTFIIFTQIILHSDQKMEINLPFTIIIPHLLPLNNFQFTNNLFHCDIINPQTIQHLTIVLTSPLPENIALSVHYSVPPYESLVYIGAISNNKPSDIFSTGWGTNIDICNIQEVQKMGVKIKSMKICVRVDEFQKLFDLQSTLREDSRKTYAKCVAQNLYNFMTSYSSDIANLNTINKSNYMVIPQDFLDKWLKKFQEKFKRDPNFIMKTTDI